MQTYIELNDPEKSDEEKIKGHKQAEGSAEIRDALLLHTFIGLDAGRHGGGVDGAHTPCRGSRVHTAALAGHGPSLWPGCTQLFLSAAKKPAPNGHVCSN